MLDQEKGHCQLNQNLDSKKNANPPFRPIPPPLTSFVFDSIF